MRLITALAILAVPACASARAQTAADTAAIDSALLAVVVRDLRSGRDDYQPPVRVPLRSDNSWAGRLYARLRSHFPELVAVDSTDTVSVRTPGLTVWVTVRDLQPRVAEAVIRWTRCTTRASTRVSFLNYWRYESRVDVRKGINSWIVDRPHMMSVEDGSC